MKTLVSAALAACLALPALAAALTPAMAHDGVHIADAYIRALGTGSAAAYFTIENHSVHPDRLLSVTTDAAAEATLHTSREDAMGMMQMLPLDGIAIEGKTSHLLAPGGDHVMLTGLTRDLKDGDTVVLHMVFERSGEAIGNAVVDNSRTAGPATAGHDDH